MTNRHLARTVDAVANQMQVVAGLTTDLRRSVGADAQTRRRWSISKAPWIVSFGC